MQWIHTASSFLAISQLVFLACLYLINFPRQRLSRLIALFCVCIISYILSRGLWPWPDLIRTPLQVLATFTPAVLWLMARNLFDDRRAIPQWIWLIITFNISARCVGLVFFEGSRPEFSLFFFTYFYIPQFIMFLLACHVIFMAYRGRDDDLVEPRRQIRVPFAIGMGSIVGLIVGSGFFWLGSAQLDSVYFIGVFLLMTFVNLVMFRLKADASHLINTASDQPVPTPPEQVGEADNVTQQEQRYIDRILKAMREDRLYAESGLTIGDLATKVSLQEYRLRRLINQTLHFRNFNQFLNQYRIEEAARRLRDPEEAHIPISSIALDVGYLSLSSFNKAFKEKLGQTPSAWRQQGQQGGPE